MKTKDLKITKEEEKMFNYLNELRESGVTNMFGAGSFLEKEFDLNSFEAGKVLLKWMDNFNEKGYEDIVE